MLFWPANTAISALSTPENQETSLLGSKSVLTDSSAANCLELPLQISQPILENQKYTYDEPLAQILLDTPLSHLQEPLTYRIPKRMQSTLCPGATVAVPFGHTRKHGWVLAIFPAKTTFWSHPIQEIKQLLSPIPALTAPIWQLIQEICRQQIGNPAQMMAWAMPKRHKGIEKIFLEHYPQLLDSTRTHQILKEEAVNAKLTTSCPLQRAAQPEGISTPLVITKTKNNVTPIQNAENLEKPLAPYLGGKAFYQRLQDSQAIHAVLTPKPSTKLLGPFPEIAATISATLQGDGNALALFPNLALANAFAHYWQQWQQTQQVEWESIVYSSAAKTPDHYQDFLNIRFSTATKPDRSQQIRLVIGVRSAIFAPLENLRLICVYDSSNLDYRVPNAPYWSAIQAAVYRSEIENTALAFIGYTRSVYEQALIDSGWAKPVGLELVKQKKSWPKRYVPDLEDRADAGPYLERIPASAMHLIKESLSLGPVLVQVPWSGHRIGLYCVRCGAGQICQSCGATLIDRGTQSVLPGDSEQKLVAVLECKECDKRWPYRCLKCNHSVFRAARIGALQTAYELQRAFNQIPVVVSAGEQEIERIDQQARIVVATPGREPIAENGYQAGLLLDAGQWLAFDQLWIAQTALSRWFQSLARVRTSGKVMLLGHPQPQIAQVFKSLDWSAWAKNELVERATLGFTPMAKVIRFTGADLELKEYFAKYFPFACPPLLSQLGHWEFFGPLPVINRKTTSSDQVSYVLRVTLAQAANWLKIIAEAQKSESAKRKTKVKIEVDPNDL